MSEIFDVYKLGPNGERGRYVSRVSLDLAIRTAILDPDVVARELRWNANSIEVTSPYDGARFAVVRIAPEGCTLDANGMTVAPN